MNWSEIWMEIEAVPISANMHQVFDRFRSNRDWPFMPVVDEDRRVLGVVREYDLKGHAYAQFGRDLVKRHPLSDFLRETLVLPASISQKELLDSSAQNPNPDGIVLTDGGTYCAVLLTRTVLRLFEQHHRENEVRLAQAQKMEAIGTLAGGIAHDLNNILTPIIGYAELMSLLLKRGEPIEQDMIDQIVVSAMRARESVKQIVTFSRHQKSERSHLSLGDMVKEAVPLIRSSLPATIEIEMSLNAEADTILANADEMHRVVLNLCTNAYHAMRERGGRLRIVVDRHQGPLLGWSMHDELLLGEYVRLSIVDTGTGIDPALLPRIFEPFFTTKKQSEGTGLGLSIVHGIVSRCKGMISVESTIGQGCSFHLYFPLLTRRAHEKPASSALADTEEERVPLDADGGPRILFVDDEFAVTRLAGAILPKYGIIVETENDSLKALAMLRARVMEFDLLVTDQTMPGITGMELTREVLKMRPDFPVIICTGYSETVSPEQAREAGVREYVHKPVDFQKVAGSIQQLTAPRARA